MNRRVSGNDELRDWVASMARSGYGADAIVRMMQQAGYGARQARQLAAKYLDQPALAMGVVAATAGGGMRTRHPLPPWVEIDGHRVDVSLCLEAPALRVLENVLTPAECDALIEQARPRLDRSLTVDSGGRQQVDRARTSSGMFFQLGENDLIRRIERRIAALVGLPVDHGEALQILHYAPGQEYEPHCDWFDPGQPGFHSITAKGGQRIASVIMYLNTPSRGGGTHFPRAGVTVTALRGSAVYFAYEGGDQESLHAGLPVAEGEKWIATKWLRERPYR